MKNILIALIAAAMMVFVSFTLLRLSGVSKGLAMNACGVVAAVFVVIHQELEKRKATKNQIFVTKSIVQFDSFGTPWYLMIIYGTILTFTASSLGGGTSGALGGAMGLDIEHSLIVSTVYMFFFTLIGHYFVGKWIGVKCIGLGVWTAILVAFLHSAIENSLTWAFASDGAFSLYFGDSPRSTWFVVVLIVSGSLIRIPFVALGYWRGRHSRLSAYFQYLLKQVPMETRNTIVTLAYDEASTHESKKCSQ